MVGSDLPNKSWSLTRQFLLKSQRLKGCRLLVKAAKLADRDTSNYICIHIYIYVYVHIYITIGCNFCFLLVFFLIYQIYHTHLKKY